MPALLKGEPGADDAVEAGFNLHLWSGGLGWLFEEWVDVTVTHPWRETTRERTSCLDSGAGADVERRKRVRYGDGVGGVYATSFAMESWGRIGDNAHANLAKLIALWAWPHQARSGASVDRKGQFRAELGVAAVRVQSATFLQATAPVP